MATARSSSARRCVQQLDQTDSSQHDHGRVARQDEIVQLVRDQVDAAEFEPVDEGCDRAQPEQQCSGDPSPEAEGLTEESGCQKCERRRNQDHDDRGRRLVHENEPAEECAGNRAHRAPKVDVADCATGFSCLLDGDLGDDRPHHPQHCGRHEEVEHDDEHRPQLPVDLVRVGNDQPDLGVDPERAKRQQRPEGKEWSDGPARIDAVGQPAPQDVPQANSGQDDPDHARPDRQ